jgi:hypothetical protein
MASGFVTKGSGRYEGCIERAAKAEAQGNDFEPELTHSEALALARSGQLARAGSLARRAVDLSEKARRPERAAVFQTAPAVWHALMGNVAEARRTAALALDMSTGRELRQDRSGSLVSTTRSSATKWRTSRVRAGRALDESVV